MTQDWIDVVIDSWDRDAQELPDRCQQFGCRKDAETWCPLCRSYFCAEHDPLYPARRHDCLRGRAEA